MPPAPPCSAASWKRARPAVPAARCRCPSPSAPSKPPTSRCAANPTTWPRCRATTWPVSRSSDPVISAPCLPIEPAAPKARRSAQARVAWGANVVTVGGDAPVRVQSMTNTDTADAIGTAIQVKELAQAGSELVRITVNTPEAAAQVPAVREQLDRMGVSVPLVGDFHYNGHLLLRDYPAC